VADVAQVAQVADVVEDAEFHCRSAHVMPAFDAGSHLFLPAKQDADGWDKPGDEGFDVVRKR